MYFRVITELCTLTLHSYLPEIAVLYTYKTYRIQSVLQNDSNICCIYCVYVHQEFQSETVQGSIGEFWTNIYPVVSTLAGVSLQ